VHEIFGTSMAGYSCFTFSADAVFVSLSVYLMIHELIPSSDSVYMPCADSFHGRGELSSRVMANRGLPPRAAACGGIGMPLAFLGPS